MTVAVVHSVEASKNNEASLSCSPLMVEVDGFNPAFSGFVLGNGTEVVACGGDVIECEFYSCGIGRVGSASHVATVSVKMKVRAVVYGKFVLG